jgi:hypothetical protein
VKDPLPLFSSSTSSSVEVEELNTIQYPSLNHSVFSAEERPANDIPYTITTNMKRRRHRVLARNESPKRDENNSSQALFGKPRDGEIVEHQTLVVSVDDDDEEESVITRHINDVSQSPYRSHRQLLLIGALSTPELNAASSSSAVIPMWVSNEEDLPHHRLDEE